MYANTFANCVGGPPSMDTLHIDCTPLRREMKMTRRSSGVTTGVTASPDTPWTRRRWHDVRATRSGCVANPHAQADVRPSCYKAGTIRSKADAHVVAQVLRQARQLSTGVRESPQLSRRADFGRPVHYKPSRV